MFGKQPRNRQVYLIFSDHVFQDISYGWINLRDFLVGKSLFPFVDEFGFGFSQ